MVEAIHAIQVDERESMLYVFLPAASIVAIYLILSLLAPLWKTKMLSHPLH